MKHVRAGWCAWAILVIVLIAVPVACSQTRADSTRADGPADHIQYCHGDWCIVRKDTLTKIASDVQHMAAHVEGIRGLCGWSDK